MCRRRSQSRETTLRKARYRRSVRNCSPQQCPQRVPHSSNEPSRTRRLAVSRAIPSPLWQAHEEFQSYIYLIIYKIAQERIKPRKWNRLGQR